MPYYEITYETGRQSVAFYKDDDEAQLALGEHVRRATNGEAGGPVAGHPSGNPGVPQWAAERVAKVRVYDVHPDDHNVQQTYSADVLTKEVSAIIKALADDNGVVDIAQLAVEVRALTHPMWTSKEHPFDSNFKMQEKRELVVA